MKLNKFSKLIASLFLSISLSQASVLAELHGTKGQADKELKSMVEKLENIGFMITSKNEHIENHYFNTFKEKNLDLLNFYTIIDKKSLRELLIKNPDFGAYAPFNLLAFKKLAKAEGGDTTWYGHLNSEIMLNIIGEKDESARKKFSDMVAKVDKLVQDEMKPTTSKKLTFDSKLPKQPLLKMVKKFEGVDDIEEYVEEFIMQHDTLFGKNEFIIAGFIDLKFEYADMDLDFEEYDAYWVSSLCHFQFSNSVFNHDAPHAGLFAPCSVYFYIPKGSNELHVGYATVENWISTTGITDKAQIEYMQKIADDVIKTFKQLGFTIEDGTGGESAKASATPRDLATEISELKAMIIKIGKDIEELKKKEPTENKVETKTEKTSAKVTPKAVELPKKEFKTAKMVIGDTAPKNLTAYYASSPQTIDSLTTKLKSNGFEVLATTEILKGKTVISITNDELKNTNTFMAVINILVNGKDEIRVQNPSYFGAAYLQSKFKYGQFKATLTSLQAVLGDMYITTDIGEYSGLKNYNFMFGMPHLDDTIELGKGDLVAKLSGEKADKYFAYSLKLPNGNTLVGHKMNPRTNKFLNKVEAGNNANLLPYQSIIKGDEAYMLNPKFYLSLSLPRLTMTDFMKIATTPDAIERELKKAYK
ncbi:hypothetical protein MNB_SV-12-744 [hydrothermal vent metagenome]|uniref:DUF302 domain-containing protein n=1 Tax=hydrothermal vent metagenome TaxID=652676 RepID=A0A1W1B9X5_9ZZZZ